MAAGANICGVDAAVSLPTLALGELTLRVAADADIPALVEILGEAEVHRWWGAYDEAAVRKDLACSPCWTIVVGGRVAGWLQVNEERDPMFPSVAFDIALGAVARGRGLGQLALRAAIAHFIEQGHHRFTIDPATDNERAIRCYEAVGFKRVGVLRAYERAPNGRWRDGLLMDLLADEFAPAGGARQRPGSSSS